MPGGDPLATCTLPVGDVYLLTYLRRRSRGETVGCKIAALPGLARRVLAYCAALLVPTAIRIVCPVAEAHSRRQTIAEYAPRRDRHPTC